MTTNRLDRAGNGTFMKGNSGGPGRPRRQVESDYVRALTDACLAETWRDIVNRAVEDARGGDATARAWLATYLIGKPAGNAPTLTKIEFWAARGFDPLASAVAADEHFSKLLEGL
ncbi:MAG: hypothetical protein ACT4QA_21825 [Panacagrimonas sp.]